MSMFVQGIVGLLQQHYNGDEGTYVDFGGLRVQEHYGLLFRKRQQLDSLLFRKQIARSGAL